MYIVTTVTHSRLPYFRDHDVARTVARLTLAREVWLESTPICWVLMPDHFHAILQIGPGDDLSAILRRFKGKSARVVNRHSGRGGHVWQASFHDRAIRNDEDVRVAARYVIANPVRAGLSAGVGGYAYWNAIWL